MFANLIESQSHGKEFKRRGRFIIATAIAYSLLFVAGGIVSIFAYDARVEAQLNDQLELINWVPPVMATQPEVRPQVVHRSTPTSAPIDRTARVQERTSAIPPTTDPRLVPVDIGTKAADVPPVTGTFKISNRNVDPPAILPNNSDTCITCNTTPPVVKIVENPPQPPKPKTETVTSRVLVSKAVNLPQPPYPTIAKQAGIQGSVNIQILVDEQGKVVSAQVVSGNPMLNTAARDAAMRARFTPTILNGQPVKVQGVITYNFVLQ